MNPVFRDGSLGHPLFVNGHLFNEPVTISHVPGPMSGLGAEEAVAVNRGLTGMYSVLATAASAVSIYHGYKRTGSVGWALGWGIFGGLLPFIALPLALAQGFGDKEKSHAR